MNFTLIICVSNMTFLIPDWNVCKWRVEEIFTIFFVADIFKEYYILRVSPLYIEQQLGK